MIRTLLSTSALLAVGGCLSYEKFLEKKAEKKCEVFQDCAGGESCGALTTADVEPLTCADFDRKAAKECLNGDWGCDDQFPGYEFPIEPAACQTVEVACAGAAAGTTL